jgi:hypothetical protein
MVSKLSEYDPGCSSRIRILTFFLPILDHGVKKALDPGPGSATLVFFYLLALNALLGGSGLNPPPLFLHTLR